ncbi:hypothetical protein B0H10DRAFT_401804 [Mycena sp. CBHHK59/15]|nr:hypothetical protein B0H10DRAFT_401804 [Mycena sp. CBHHK59/15]
MDGCTVCCLSFPPRPRSVVVSRGRVEEDVGWVWIPFLGIRAFVMSSALRAGSGVRLRRLWCVADVLAFLPGARPRPCVEKSDVVYVRLALDVWACSRNPSPPLSLVYSSCLVPAALCFFLQLCLPPGTNLFSFSRPSVMSIIFCTALSEYDQVLEEERRVVRAFSLCFLLFMFLVGDSPPLVVCRFSPLCTSTSHSTCHGI